MPFVSTGMSTTTVARAAALLMALGPASLLAQHQPPDVRSRDSVTVAAGAHFRAGGLRRWLLGGTYRDLWTRPIRVPVLNLHTFGGGLRPTKLSGGAQTMSLRFVAADGQEYNFRSVDKDNVFLPPGMQDVKLARSVGLDMVSNSHPASAVIAASLLESAGVLHESPALVVMPDDPLLGEHRKVFAHRLGTIAQYPAPLHSDAPMFAGAIDIIDSDTLLQLLNRSPADRVNAAAFLTARLMDMLVNNWDRHPGQWKWARLRPRGPWEPVSRDYDKAFNSVSGFLPGVLRLSVPTMVRFDSGYPAMRGLTFNSMQFDRRILGGLSRPTWDSVARALVARLTNAAIDAAVQAMPPEYRSTAPALAARLRVRRDSLPAVAGRFYRFLAGIIDIHATDAADHATIARVDDQNVEVRLADAGGRTYFSRRFDTREVPGIRVYLHGGDDFATITGDVHRSVPVWIIGGNGTNTATDASVVGGESGPTHLHEKGTVTTVRYPEPDTAFNRRPLVREFGHLDLPARDYGRSASPTAGLSINRDMGVMPRIGMTWKQYSFRHEPYASRVALEARYSVKNSGATVSLATDNRRESSPVHFTTLTRMSQLELLNYHGPGNLAPQSLSVPPNVSAPRTDYYAVHNRQWLFQPGLAVGLGTTTNLSLGPVLKYSITDSTPESYISNARPYGFGRFGEAGLQLRLAHDDHFPLRHAQHGSILDLSATYYPALWDVRSGFSVLDAFGAVYFTLPIPLHPYLGLRGGAKKVSGDFPFQESAFIGGRADVRTLDPQRYAGDASLYATAELRIPVAKFTAVLPLNTGLLATGDMGRVYVKGVSPDGWHSAVGAGFWVGFHELTIDIRVMRANDFGKAAVIALRFATPGGTE